MSVTHAVQQVVKWNWFISPLVCTTCGPSTAADVFTCASLPVHRQTDPWRGLRFRLVLILFSHAIITQRSLNSVPACKFQKSFAAQTTGWLAIFVCLGCSYHLIRDFINYLAACSWGVATALVELQSDNIWLNMGFSKHTQASVTLQLKSLSISSIFTL